MTKLCTFGYISVALNILGGCFGGKSVPNYRKVTCNRKVNCNAQMLPLFQTILELQLEVRSLYFILHNEQRFISLLSLNEHHQPGIK